jgi:hypothetical protein
MALRGTKPNSIPQVVMCTSAGVYCAYFVQKVKVKVHNAYVGAVCFPKSTAVENINGLGRHKIKIIFLGSYVHQRWSRNLDTAMLRRPSVCCQSSKTS